MPEPSDAVLALIDLAVRGGAPDNVTCIVADVIDTDHSGVAPTSAPVIVGAAASAGSHDTKPFGRPGLDDGAGLTTMGAVPAGAARSGSTMPGQAMPAEASVPRSFGQHSQPSPAATLAGGRHASEPIHIDEEQDQVALPRRRRRWPLMTTLLGLFVVLIGAGLFVGYQYVHSQYYVGTESGKVVVYRGLDQKLLGISLSSVFHRTTVPVAAIPSEDAQAIQQNSPGSLSQANSLVANITSDYRRCQRAYADLHSWYAHKPKPITKRVRVHGKLVTRTITPHYRPKPHIPSDCPAQSS